MENFKHVSALLQQATADGAKSTVLRPIAWMMSICVTGVLASAGTAAPPWVTIMFAIFSGCTMALYLGTYVFCLVCDRDALRTETYSIQKMALERAYIGDSSTGMVLQDIKPPSLAIGTAVSHLSEDQR